MNNKNKTISIISYLAATLVIIQGGILFYRLVTNEKLGHPRDTYTNEDLNKFYNDCIIGGAITQYYPEIAKANCQCLTDSLTNKYTKVELIGFEKLTAKEKYTRIKDIVDFCAHRSGRDTVHVISK
jgi:hypothetical protein